jgi:hypothetical protein
MDARSIQLVNGLEPSFAQSVRAMAEYLERVHHWPVAIVSGVRTPQEQHAAVLSGHSWTEHSKHLEGRAVDWAFVINGTVSWNPPVGSDGDPLFWWKWLQVAARSYGMSNPAWSRGDYGHTEQGP